MPRVRGRFVKHPRRRLALRLAACAVIGAVATVLVSWGCACWSHARIESRTDSLAAGWPPPRAPDISESLRSWVQTDWLRPSSEDPAAYVSALEERRGGFGLLYHTVELQEELPPLRKGHPDAFVGVFRCGWPARSLLCSVESSWASVPPGKPAFQWRFGLPAPRWMHAEWLETGYYNVGSDSRRFPCFPLWPGFALDTAFYGTLAFLLWSAPGYVRTTRRRRRGRCVACGYELKGMPVCPECGRGGQASTIRRS